MRGLRGELNSVLVHPLTKIPSYVIIPKYLENRNRMECSLEGITSFLLRPSPALYIKKLLRLAKIPAPVFLKLGLGDGTVKERIKEEAPLSWRGFFFNHEDIFVDQDQIPWRRFPLKVSWSQLLNPLWKKDFCQFQKKSPVLVYL